MYMVGIQAVNYRVRKLFLKSIDVENTQIVLTSHLHQNILLLILATVAASTVKIHLIPTNLKRPASHATPSSSEGRGISP